jgi:hypothetical protein
LKAEKKHQTIKCDRETSLAFQDGNLVIVADDRKPRGSTRKFREVYTNETGGHAEIFFTGSAELQIDNVEVFEIADFHPLLFY